MLVNNKLDEIQNQGCNKRKEKKNLKQERLRSIVRCRLPPPVPESTLFPIDNVFFCHDMPEFFLDFVVESTTNTSFDTDLCSTDFHRNFGRKNQKGRLNFLLHPKPLQMSSNSSLSPLETISETNVSNKTCSKLSSDSPVKSTDTYENPTK